MGNDKSSKSYDAILGMLVYRITRRYDGFTTERYRWKLSRWRRDDYRQGCGLSLIVERQKIKRKRRHKKHENS
jgi:hypothetical protein